MASRLRPSGVKPVGNSKLARPPGSGLRPPSGSGIRRPSPQPSSEISKQSSSPSAGKRVAGQPTRPVRQPGRPAQATAGGSANREQALQVGDKVLVNGKHGVLAFLGTTQFANGNWAGIVLESLEGKNNGSVNGVQYFDCESNRGLFAKPEKIKFVSRGDSQLVASSTKPPVPPASEAQYQFSVGDTVLVEGQKEGVLGFLGTTQFARGVWAGVILDTPEGKNDGTVSGVRYFECRADHGLFTRPQKLTLIAKATGTPQQSTPQLLSNRPVSEQEGEQRSSQPTPVDLKVLHDKLKIGDQVLVGGVKEGILRYLGPTEFAKGIWVGVELPEPMGKNDGAISGKRYFQCQSKHGLFAPLPKVEKLATAGSEGVPSLAASSPTSSPYHSPKVNAAVHGSRAGDQGAGASWRGRHPSESSVSSFGSSRLAQDKLTAGSLQGSTAADLSLLLQEKDATIESLQVTLDQREGEKLAHQEELTELRRQVDDLQFQLEEQDVISGDQLESATETNVQKVSNLTEELERERKLTQELRDQLKSNEGADPSSGHKVAELESKLEERMQEVSTHLETIAQLTVELQEARERVSAADAAADTLAISLQQELEDAKLNLECERSRCSTLELELSQTEVDLETERGRLTSLQQELSSTRQGSQGELDQRSSLEKELVVLEQTAKDLQDELGVSRQELEQALELCGEHEALIAERNGELGTMEEKLRQMTKEQELWSGEKSRLQTEQERLIAERDKAITECDRLMTKTSNASMEQSELSQQRRELLSERDSLLAQQQAMHTEHEKVLSERDELNHLLSELQKQKEDVLGASQQMSLKFSSTEAELAHKESEMDYLKKELKTQQEIWENEKFNLQEQIELARASATDIERHASTAARERDSTLQEAQELADRLEKVQTERDGLKLDLETALVQVDELQFQLDELSTRHQSLEQDNGAEILAVQQRLEATEGLLSERERELANAQERISSLSDDLIVSQGKHDQDMLEEEKMLLEEEKQLLEERVKELTLQLEKSQQREKRDSKVLLAAVPSNGNDSMSSRLEETQTQLLEAQARHEDLLQEIEDYKQQTEFLNSVISDLQNKLEGVEAMKGLHGHMESISSDYVVDEDEDALLESLPPPRLFCDICDVFDQHDTDDCPMQAMSDSPPHTMHHGVKAPGGSDRPYCNNCEIFGHWTEDCEYEATY